MATAENIKTDFKIEVIDESPQNFYNFSIMVGNNSFPFLQIFNS